MSFIFNITLSELFLNKTHIAQSSQVYLYNAFHNIDCIKAASRYQTKQQLKKKHPRLIELFKGINEWSINLNTPLVHLTMMLTC